MKKKAIKETERKPKCTYIVITVCNHEIVPSPIAKYSGPSILRPPMGPRKCGLILQVVSK